MLIAHSFPKRHPHTSISFNEKTTPSEETFFARSMAYFPRNHLISNLGAIFIF
ncbi:hypothetical protein SD77_0778 [Bacillus badius]|uniref:Uncharacterized protein n=1 Tax=Bacillus badius TaxID=1455 RepID=A0ABR5ATT7_BACBA|nr:hypothetical protein SD77_0778 [Bacillus badius]